MQYINIIYAMTSTLILEITNWSHSPYIELKASFKPALISELGGNG